MAYVAKLPGGGAVVVDGVVDHCTQAQAETYVVRAQQVFIGWITSCVEATGKGDDFVQVIRRNPTLRMIPQPAGRRKKEDKWIKEMSPWLENGVVRISDAETPFLMELRRELDNYPEHDHDDALDALYYALRGMPDVLSLPRAQEELPLPYRREKQKNPLFAFGRR
jgi:predicted phage terminase large subunit-like protein